MKEIEKRLYITLPIGGRYITVLFVFRFLIDFKESYKNEGFVNFSILFLYKYNVFEKRCVDILILCVKIKIDRYTLKKIDRLSIIR